MQGNKYIRDMQPNQTQQKTAQQLPASADSIIAKVIDSVKENLSAELLRELYNIQKEQRKTHAEEIFNRQMVQLQRSLPKILKARAATSKEGYVRFSYSSFDDIMSTIKEIIAEFGFYCTFSQSSNNDHIVITCKVTHEAGHSIEVQSPPIPVENTSPDGKPIMTKRQAISAAITQGKKECLKMAFNLTFSEDKQQHQTHNNNKTYGR